MSRLDARWLRLVALLLGLAAMLAYAACQSLEPHGVFEFAYAPFTPEALPYSAMRGFTYEQLWGHVRRVCLFGPGLLLAVWGLLPFVRVFALPDLRRLTRWACAACLALTALLMLGVLRGRALTDDELAYAMQAGFFGHGQIAGPDLGVTPTDYFTVPTRLGYSIKYLMGEPLLQIPGVLLGVPALMHLPVVLVTLTAWHETLRRCSGLTIARWATIFLACSPMLIFTSATGLSHATCLMWVVLMGLGAELARGDKPILGAALAGISFSFGFVTRPQSLAPIGAVLGVFVLFQLLRRRAWLGVATLAACAASGLLLVLGYDWKLSGSALKLPWFLQCGAEHYGFGKVWVTRHFEHGFGTALENLGVVAVRLNAWLLGWPLSLGVVAVWLALGRRRAGAGVWLWVGAALLLFEFFYYSPGSSDTGSIYHYELVLPFSLMAAQVASQLVERFPGWAPLALSASFVLGTGSWLLEQGLRVERLVSTIHRQSDLVLAQVSRPALLIYERRENEVVQHGWVFDAFPRRFRAPEAAVVTLPRITRDMPARAARVYPGRQCYYFHYRPGTNEPELLRCEQAASWLERPVVDSDNTVAAYIERPTAYRKTDFAPAAIIERSRVRDAEGQPILLCCQVRRFVELGLEQDQPRNGTGCIESGEP